MKLKPRKENENRENMDGNLENWEESKQGEKLKSEITENENACEKNVIIDFVINQVFNATLSPANPVRGNSLAVEIGHSKMNLTRGVDH